VAIRPAFLPTLERVADVLARSSDADVLVIGHTDAMGSAAYNRQLSAERAEAVRQALATYGIDASRIRAEGRGEAEPRGDNRTVAGRQANRRVEIMISPA
jgi:outer membrane protein OmpA-like peptidoglycan-associated protein